MVHPAKSALDGTLASVSNGFMFNSKFDGMLFV